MSLPSLNSQDDAEAVIAAVLNDVRIAQLRRDFSPVGGLPAIISHAESLLPALETASERVQVKRILARWSRMVRDTQVGPSTLDGVGALVADARAWDVRVGAERDAIPTSVELFPAETADLVMSIARDWSMTASSSPEGHFDAVIPIGGLVRANLSRPAYVARLLGTGAISTAMVIGLASERATSAAERRDALEVGAPSDTEQAALEFGLERAFGFRSTEWSWTSANGLKKAPRLQGFDVFIGAAPASSLTGRRAMTGEAFAWLLTTGVLPDDARLLQITATHCWLANHVAILTRMPHGSRVQTVGQAANVPARSSLSDRQQGSQRYLQEMKAFVDSLPRLRRWANRLESISSG